MQMDNFDAMTGRGYRIWFMKPELTPIDPEDIRFAASNICRYNGHCKWSLLQHLTLCTLLAQFHTQARRIDMPLAGDEYLVAQCACHDMHETYVGDVITGLKKYLSEFKTIELAWETYVLSTFDLDLPTGEVKKWVKYIDNRALTLEMMGAHHLSAGRVAQAFGTPETEELNIYTFVKELDPQACWLIVKSAIDTYKELGETYGESRDQ